MEDFQHYILGLNWLGGREQKHDTVLILAGSDNLPIPCPGIMRQKDIDKALSGEISAGKKFAHAVIPFSPRDGYSLRHKTGVTPQIIRMDSRQLIEGHRIEVLDKFPLNSIRELATMAQERGGISFIISDRKEMTRTVNGLIGRAEKVFKYVECMKYETDAYSRELVGDDLVLSVTFMDLPYCIPIYDTRNMDGVGVMVSLFHPKATERSGSFHHHCIYATVLSNFAENLYKIDGGSKINKQSGFPGGLTEHFASVIKDDAKKAKLEAKSDDSGSAPKPKAKKAKTAKRFIEERIRKSSSATFAKYTSTSTTSTW